ncbi:unnamed protein product [Didymodactylos carnosus]|uniref:Ion transport domain-containing protein n=1 Tax=Didymodactylos carnosus TaxID=1234261 RepID=A0A8S2EXH4_9BILA|nr:unnamed protein product [Didymodactylos carnosus]CAF4083595.1 unnamed protein product [Didymodactylos carnosus]
MNEYFVLLVDYFPLNINGGKRSGYSSISIPITEIFLHICMWSLIVEEAREFYDHCDEERLGYSSNILLKFYTDDKWNVLDLMAIIFYIVAFITRFIVIESVFVVSKICMCIDLFLCVTLQRVNLDAHQRWAYHRFLLVNEYSKKSVLPPPINVFSYGLTPLVRLTSLIVRQCSIKNDVDVIQSSETMNPVEQGETQTNKFKERDMMLRESSIAEDYWSEKVSEIMQEEKKEHSTNTKLPLTELLPGRQTGRSGKIFKPAGD